MSKLICTVTLGFLCQFALAQDTLLLHPAIERIIDKETKRDYLLFPEIKDSLFQYCYVTRVDKRYMVTSRFTNDSTTTREVDSETLAQYQENITKLLEYYTNKAKNDSLKQAGGAKAKANSYTDQKVNKGLAAPPMTQQMKDEIRRDTRMRDDAQRMQDYQQGLGPGPVNIELFSTGKKKDK